MPYGDRNFQIDFDFIDHQLKIITSKGERSTFGLHDFSVAHSYQKIFTALADLAIHISIRPNPAEILNPIRFEQDTLHHTYDGDQALAFHTAIRKLHDVFLQCRGAFVGKCSPIHFFWGSFDVARSLFSGQNAPKHPGGVPGLPDWVAQEAYSREVTSSGRPFNKQTARQSNYLNFYTAPISPVQTWRNEIGV